METTKRKRNVLRELSGARLEKQLGALVKKFLRNFENFQEARTMGSRSEALPRLSSENKMRSSLFSLSADKEFEDDDDEYDDTDLSEVRLTRDKFNHLVEDKSMERMLIALDISTSNRWQLFDVLDADMSGEVTLYELIYGLMSLRGPTEKTDSVATLLCARSVQQTLLAFVHETRENFKVLGDKNKETRERFQQPVLALVQDTRDQLKLVGGNVEQSKPKKNRTP